MKSHTIIEAHPDVHAHMLRRGWGDKANVTILFGRWQDVADQLGEYDGIFFDTYSEHYEHMQVCFSCKCAQLECSRESVVILCRFCGY